jgi:PPOX class probable F420-dependent enzyme
MLEPAIKSLASTGRNFGTVSVHLASGDIATNVMWVDADDEHMLFNTEVHRAKFKAVQADPRVTVMVWNAENPYSFAEVRGTVVDTVTGDEARAHIDALSRRYTGKDYAGQIQSERVIVKVRPDKQFARNLT